MMPDQPHRTTPPPLPPIPPQMSKQPAKPAFPAPKPANMPVGTKIVLMGVLCCLLMIGALIIWLMAYDRKNTNADVSHDIIAQWGDNTCLDGPVITAGNTDSTKLDGVAPAVLNVDANVETMSLHRGIYEAEVFTTAFNLSGHFDSSAVKKLSSDSLMISISIDPANITDTTPLTIGNRKYTWNRSDSTLYTYIDLSTYPSDSKLPFSTGIKARGSGGLFIMPIAGLNDVTINGSAANPSFSGAQLPVSRHLDRDHFSARWSVKKTEADGSYIGTRFLIGVDRYQKVCRVIKYAFIIIILTFFSVFFTEVTMRHPIPMFNYFLIGVALILFYSLLLALAEHLSFGLSYLIAAIMTVGLITCYMWKMLNSKTVGLSICAILSIMYGFCYVMLCISTYALLFGSLLLFAALAATMYGSLKIQYR